MPKLAMRSEPKPPERTPERAPEKHELLTASTLPPPPPRSTLGTVAGPMATPVTNPMMLNPVLSRVMATNARPRTPRADDYATASAQPTSAQPPAPAVNRAAHYSAYPKDSETPRMVSALGNARSLLAPPVPVGGTTQAALLESR
jgi:hypothetical protein